MASDETPQSRVIRVAVQDRGGHPAGRGWLAFHVNGRPRGSVNLGSGADYVTLANVPTEASVELVLEVGNYLRRAMLPPEQDRYTFVDVPTPLGFAPVAKVPPQPRCPDGTTNSPCVTCRDGDDEWTICAR